MPRSIRGSLASKQSILQQLDQSLENHYDG